MTVPASPRIILSFMNVTFIHVRLQSPATEFKTLTSLERWTRILNIEKYMVRSLSAT